jgi:hypothetical protein
MNPLWFNWRTDFLFPLFQPGGARNWGQIHDGIPAGYYIEGMTKMKKLANRLKWCRKILSSEALKNEIKFHNH